MQAAQTQLLEQSTQAKQVGPLLFENAQLRALLDLRERAGSQALAADVLYDAADPFSRKVVIGRGQVHGVQPGMAVVDAAGVLGQVTRVYPTVSRGEFGHRPRPGHPRAQLAHRGPLLGVWAVGHGPIEHGASLHPNSADLKVGDQLTTSGVDGVYPPGLAVGQVRMVDQRSNSAFANIVVDPVANTHGAMQVLVLARLGEPLPPSPLASPAVPAATGAVGAKP